jgi:hypothetical protein
LVHLCSARFGTNGAATLSTGQPEKQSLFKVFHGCWHPFKIVKAAHTLVPVFNAWTRDGNEFMNKNGQVNLAGMKSYAQTPEQQAALEVLMQEQNPP